MKIMVIEDDHSIREVLSEALEIDGYEVVTATNGAEGLKALNGVHTPDLILLDHMMPKMSGVEFLERMKSDKRFENIPVIMLSGVDLTQEISQPFLLKPFSLDELAKTVEKYKARCAEIGTTGLAMNYA